MIDSTKDEDMCMRAQVIVDICRNDKKTLCLSAFEPE
jgi:hypothetical protein